MTRADDVVGTRTVALGVAMFRHGLFDGDRLLHRTLVYIVLTALVACVFAVSVGFASTVIGGSGVGAVVAAAIIALGLSPTRAFVQRLVRLLYGQRRDPYAALTGLDHRLAVAIDPEEVLPTVVRTVAGALRLPISAPRPETLREMASRGAGWCRTCRSRNAVSRAAGLCR